MGPAAVVVFQGVGGDQKSLATVRPVANVDADPKQRAMLVLFQKYLKKVTPGNGATQRFYHEIHGIARQNAGRGRLESPIGLGSIIRSMQLLDFLSPGFVGFEHHDVQFRRLTCIRGDTVGKDQVESWPEMAGVPARRHQEDGSIDNAWLGNTVQNHGLAHVGE